MLSSGLPRSHCSLEWTLFDWTAAVAAAAGDAACSQVFRDAAQAVQSGTGDLQEVCRQHGSRRQVPGCRRGRPCTTQ